jgi:hypothetical protein
MKIAPAIVVLLAAISPAAAAPLDDAACQVKWEQADVDKNGSLNAEEAKTVISNFVLADVDKNGSIDAGEFKAACKAGLVK